MPYITSTMAVPVTYCLYKDLAGKARAVAKEISINGGANVADKRTILTPTGVCTQITDEELELLRKNPVFVMHEKKGFVAVVNTKYKEEAEKAAESLEEKDKSAPKTPEDFEEEEPAPKTKKKRAKK